MSLLHGMSSLSIKNSEIMTLRIALCSITILCTFSEPLWAQLPDTAQASGYLTKSKSLFGQGRFAEAVPILEDASAIFAPYPERQMASLLELGKHLYWLSRYDESKNVLQKAFRIHEQHPSENTSLLKGRGLIVYGASYSELSGDYKGEIGYIKEALELIIPIKGENSFDVAEAYNSIGLDYGLLGDNLSELKYLKKALEIYLATVGKDHVDVATCYSNIALCYLKLQDIEQMHYYNLQSLEIRERITPPNYPLRAINYNTLGFYCAASGDYDKQVEYLQQAYDLVSNAFGLRHVGTITFLNNLGEAKANNGDTAEAEKLLLQALSLSQEIYGNEHLYTFKPKKQLANLFQKTEQAEREIQMLLSALESLNGAVSEMNPVRAQGPLLMAKYWERQGDFSRAEQYTTEAVEILLPRGDDLSMSESIKLAADPLLLTDVLYTKAEIARNKLLQQKDNPTAADWEALLESYGHAIKAAETNRMLYTTTNSRQRRNQANLDLYEKAIATALRLYKVTNSQKWLHTAFGYADKSRADILLQALGNPQHMRFAGVPDSLIAHEQQLKAQLGSLRQKLESAQYQKNKQAIQQLSNQRLDLIREYEGFIKQIESEFPDYYRLKYGDQKTDINTLQQSLPESTAMVQYFYGKKALYIFCITSNDIDVQQITDMEALQQPLSKLLKTLNDTEGIIKRPKQAKTDYFTTAHAMHQMLIAPMGNFLDGISRLVIVPDGKLGHLNFGLLLQDPPSPTESYGALDYLIKKYSVAYAYSAQVLLQNLAKNSNAELAYGGFAPDYSDFGSLEEGDAPLQTMRSALLRSGDYELPGAAKEVTAVAGLLKGDTWTGKQVTENLFKQKASDYRILQLSMHALLDDSRPLRSHLLFRSEGKKAEEDGRLTISEIYHLQLDAEMVMISACNSGLGKIQRGEGPMSLARAFTWAGCPSVVMGLWPLPDQTTEQISISFFKALKQGLPKDLALQQAKMDFLQNNDDPILAHPFFWGGLVVTGSPRAVFEPQNNWLTAAILLVSLMLPGAFIWMRRNKSKKMFNT